MSIQEHLNKIRNAIYGREVRESIAKGIETAYDDASEKDNANMEVKIARGTHPNLRSRLEEVDNKQQQTTTQLAQTERFLENKKIDKGDVSVNDINKSKGLLDETYMSDEFKQQMAGNTSIHSTPADESLTTKKYADDSITFSKVENELVDTSIFDSKLLSEEYFNFSNVGNFIVDKRIVTNSSNFEDRPGINITDFIRLPKNSTLILNRNGINAFSIYGLTGNVRIAEYDVNKNWISTTMVAELEDYVADTDKYVRISYENKQNYLITTSRHKKINSNLIDGEKIESYIGEQPVVSYNPASNILGKGYVGFTQELTNSTDVLITGHIFIPKNTTPKIVFDGVEMNDSGVTENLGTKLIVFDRDKNWISTSRISNSQEIIFDQDVYIQLQFNYMLYTLDSVTVEGFNKIKRELVEGFSLNDNDKVSDSKEVDLAIFMGQSNMSGRGIADEAPTPTENTAFEFRSITDPTRLYQLREPFGVNENKSGGISENNKTGSMVSAFAIEYNKSTDRPLVAVSASKGGSRISEWLPGTPYLTDSIQRFKTAETWLENNGYTVKNKFMVWNQGESDASWGLPLEEYQTDLEAMINEMVSNGVEHCYFVRIGKRVGMPDWDEWTQNMIDFQTEFCRTNENAVLASVKFAEMTPDGLDLMKSDGVHYTQAGYNLAGKEAGINTAYHINSRKEPIIYDAEYDSLYFSKSGY